MNKIKFWWKRLRNPENIWYGNGLKRDTALASVGSGWSTLINNLYDAKPRWVHIVQVKEKWGTLRFYTSGSPTWYDDLIDLYERESGSICEVCGDNGNQRDDLGWIRTLCDMHYLEELARLGKVLCRT
jgi:hypothetical protein